MSGDPDIDHERELREQWQRLHMEMHVTMDKARDIAGADINRRLEGMNELRTQINSERGLYLSREVFDREHAQLSREMDTRLKALETKGSNLDGRMWTVGTIMTIIITFTVLAINLFFRK
jgi:hypothetical protein